MVSREQGSLCSLHSPLEPRARCWEAEGEAPGQAGCCHWFWSGQRPGLSVPVPLPFRPLCGEPTALPGARLSLLLPTKPSLCPRGVVHPPPPMLASSPTAQLTCCQAQNRVPALHPPAQAPCPMTSPPSSVPAVSSPGS